MMAGHIERERFTWEQLATHACWIINHSGFVKRPVRPRQLVKFNKKPTEIDIEKRRKEAMESFKFAKQKFWTKLKGRSADEVKVLGEDN